MQAAIAFLPKSWCDRIQQKKQAGVPPPQAKCSSHLVSSSSSARILPEAPQKTTPASSTAPRARPPVRPENQAKPRAVPVQGNDAAARDAHRPERATGAPHREERAVRAVRAAVARRGARTEAARDVRAAAPLLLCVAQVCIAASARWREGDEYNHTGPPAA